ncbi:MAG: hypothetical protein ACTHKG_16145 [Nocardioides sp.]
MPDDWQDAWGAALDELELTLEQTERILNGEPLDEVEATGWNPPPVSGPIPAQYVVRARTLLDRQQALISETVTATVGIRQKLDLLDKLTGSRRGARDEHPVYVDLTA